MKVKITKNVLFIPPFISSSWHNISSLQAKEGTLIISMIDGDVVEIPNLPEETLTRIFTTHLNFIEQESEMLEEPKDGINAFMFSPVGLTAFQQLPFKMGFGGIEGMSSALQHNPNQANMPDLPKEILQKISAIAGIINPEGLQLETADTEPHCNCYHCQIVRAMQGVEHRSEETRDLLADLDFAKKDLTSEQWEITQSGKHQYTVKNRLNEKEQYTVHLDDPIGCSCKKPSCDHLIAVLES